MFNRLKKALGLGAPAPAAPSTFNFDLPRIPADQNPFGLDLIDLRPFASTVVATSKDPRMAQNAVSYGQRDGREVIGPHPELSLASDCDLRYPCDPRMPDGRMFEPASMDHKWAVYHYDRRLYFIRSWTASVDIIADTRLDGASLLLTRLHRAPAEGPQAAEVRDPAFIARRVDFLMKALCLGMPAPCPLHASQAPDPQAIAMTCWAHYGRHALVATYGDPTTLPPAGELRCSGELDMAIQRGDRDRAMQLLLTGAPVDTRAAYDAITPLHAAAAVFDLPMIDALVQRGADLEAKGLSGLTPLHYAAARFKDDPGAVAKLLDLGADVNARSGDGSSVLQFAVQARQPALVRLLLDRGADPDLASHRGFVPLHSAAEMGESALCDMLLAAGARTDINALGHTPRSLAEQRGHPELAAKLGPR